MNEDQLRERVKQAQSGPLNKIGDQGKDDLTSVEEAMQRNQPPASPELQPRVEGLSDAPMMETVDASTSVLDDLGLYLRVRLKRIIGDEIEGKATELLPVNPFKLFSLATGWWKPVAVVIIGIVSFVIIKLTKKA